jgi:hypothetical protein
MPGPFVITTPTPTPHLDDKRHTEAVFTVHNKSGHWIHARARIVTQSATGVCLLALLLLGQASAAAGHEGVEARDGAEVGGVVDLPSVGLGQFTFVEQAARALAVPRPFGHLAFQPPPRDHPFIALLKLFDQAGPAHGQGLMGQIGGGGGLAGEGNEAAGGEGVEGDGEQGGISSAGNGEVSHGALAAGRRTALIHLDQGEEDAAGQGALDGGQTDPGLVGGVGQGDG